MKRIFALLGLSTTLLCTNAHAQSIEDRLRQQYQATVEQLRQLQDQQASLQAAKTAAEQERDALKKQLASAQAALAQARRGTADTGAFEQSLAKYKQALTQATDGANKTSAERDSFKAAVERQKAVLDACEAKNTQLVKVGNEILDAYKNFDVMDAMEAKEPFVGSKRVEMENIAQDFGDKIYDGKFDPRTVHPPAEKPAAAPAQPSTSASTSAPKQAQQKSPLDAH